MLLINGFTHGSSPFVPTDIAGCTLWTAADEIVGLNDGDPVGTWEDLTGNGNDFLQTGSSRPTYNTNMLNGKPVITFVAASVQYMQTAGVVPALAQPYTCFTVVKVTGAGFQCILDSKVTAAGLLRINSDNTGYQVFASSDLADVAATPSNWNYLGAIINGASSNLYINGSSNPIVTGAAGVNGVSVGALGNGASLLDGQVAEVIYYNSLLSGGDIVLVNTYLATKYGL